MTNFEYTHTQPVDSSAVDKVHYNANADELAVTLHDSVYLYTGVPLSEYWDLVEAVSVGRAFQSIKSNYGPSDYLGDEEDVYFTRVVHHPLHVRAGVNRAGTGAPQNWSDSANVYITLPVPEVKSEFHEYAVTFATETGLKTTSVHEVSIGEAVANVENIGEMLNLDFDVVKVERLD